MTRHDVIVKQLRPAYGDAFLNVKDGRDDGAVSVWGSCYKTPVYLCQSGINFELVVFSDDDWALEGLLELGQQYDRVIQIEPLEE